MTPRQLWMAGFEAMLKLGTAYTGGVVDRAIELADHVYDHALAKTAAAEAEANAVRGGMTKKGKLTPETPAR